MSKLHSARDVAWRRGRGVRVQRALTDAGKPAMQLLPGDSLTSRILVDTNDMVQRVRAG